MARTVIPVAMCLLALSNLTGCARKTLDYTPSLAVAESAVRSGLEAWKSGQSPGEVAGTSPVIHVTDAGRKPGQTLDDFQILGEVRGSAGRTMAVTLHLSNPSEVIKTRYIVVGIDPLWVFRQEDYELLMHWDHHMPATDAPEGPPDANGTAIERSPEQTTQPSDAEAARQK